MLRFMHVAACALVALSACNDKDKPHDLNDCKLEAMRHSRRSI
jgi:hypothetical protein